MKRLRDTTLYDGNGLTIRGYYGGFCYILHHWLWTHFPLLTIIRFVKSSAKFTAYQGIRG